MYCAHNETSLSHYKIKFNKRNNNIERKQTKKKKLQEEGKRVHIIKDNIS